MYFLVLEKYFPFKKTDKTPYFQKQFKIQSKFNFDGFKSVGGSKTHFIVE